LISPHLHIENSTAVLEKSQACYLPISKHTQMPIIGPHVNYQNLLIAAGHSFWGILNAPITGKIISELVLQGQICSVDPLVMSYFVPE
jgi:glycine/D-amino acid oxidase-like deaminating enzyme